MKIGSRSLGGAKAGLLSRTVEESPSGNPPFADLLSFDRLVVTIEPELRRFVSRRIRPDAIDDVLQEIWVAAWQALPRFDNRSKIRTWIYGICVHKCHDHYRDQRSQERFVPLDDLLLVDGLPSVENVVVQADTITRLLAGLDETQREVLELYYYAQLTLAEIATILDRNLNTVKYQFYRAHSQLASAGEKEGLR